MKKIANEIVVWRAKLGLSQQELAKMIGTTQHSVAMWETGKSIPRRATCVKIAVALGLPDDYFFSDESDIQDKEPKETQYPELIALERAMNDSKYNLDSETRKVFTEIFKNTFLDTKK